MSVEIEVPYALRGKVLGYEPLITLGDDIRTGKL